MLVHAGAIDRYATEGIVGIRRPYRVPEVGTGIAGDPAGRQADHEPPLPAGFLAIATPHRQMGCQGPFSREAVLIE